MSLAPFEFAPRTRVVFGVGSFARLGELARELGFRRTLLAADAGLRAAGHAEQAASMLRKAGVEVIAFHDFAVNPDSAMIDAGAGIARAAGVDSLVGLGGGSSLDCTKGIAFVLANGGTMRDFWGYGKASHPLPPMIGVPASAGTGSEAQSYALISDSKTHAKMACGAPTAAFRVALLDPALTLSQPRSVTAAAGYDALSHAVESYVTTRRNPLSEMFAREAWRLLEAHYESVLESPDNLEARGAMLLGAHYAGVAIENSMLGATHACANPLTARYGTVHGVAIGLLLPHVVRWNAPAAALRYGELLALSARRPSAEPATALAQRLEALAVAGGLPRGLRSIGVPRGDLEPLVADAAQQWTGRFNPRPFDAAAARELYETAF